MPDGTKDDGYVEPPNDSRSVEQVDAAATTNEERPRTYYDCAAGGGGSGSDGADDA